MNLYCKNCGSEIEVKRGQKIAVCDFCGMEQTLPKLDDPKKIELFISANDYRMTGRFDIAKKAYDEIISAYPDDNEAYWCKLLCEYGIEYVDDVRTESKIPTCHRTVRESIFNNRDYKFIIKRATKEEKAIYEAEAKEIDRIQKEIIKKADSEEPYDIFICYKESEDDGRRTRDSQIATKIYTNLTNKGYKVFFARVTLNELAGSKYEPIIYSALNTAKVMLVVTTTKEHVNAPWVRNEWSRYLEFMQNDYAKVIVPCISMMDAYDLPDELSDFQALDTTDMDFIENLTRQIDSKFGRQTMMQIMPDDTVSQVRTAQNYTQPSVQQDVNSTVQPLLKRIEIFLSDEDWNKADEYAEKVLDIYPECAEAYLGKLLVELKLTDKAQLMRCVKPFDTSKHYQKAVRFSGSELRKFLTDAANSINANIENAKKQSVYENALRVVNKAKTESEFKEAYDLFVSLNGFSDSRTLAKQCKTKIDELKKNSIYLDAEVFINQDSLEYYEKAEKLYLSLGDWKDSKEKAELCRSVIDDIKAQQETEHNISVYDKAKLLMKGENISDYEKAITLFESIIGWKDSKTQIKNCQKKIDKIKEKREKERIEAEERAERVRIEREMYEAEQARIAEVCKKLFSEFLTAKSENEIKKLVNDDQKSLDTLVSNQQKLIAIIEELPSIVTRLADTRKQLDECISSIPKLYSEKSGLSIFAIKRKKQIEEELKETESRRYQLAGIKRTLEDRIKREAFGYENAEDVKKELEKIELQIEALKKKIESYDFVRSKELVLAELRNFEFGKKMYKDYLENEKFESVLKAIVNAKKDSTVKFGKYFNKNKTNKEDIEWIVIAHEGDRVLLLSKYGLDCKLYNETYKDVTWETCTLRAWLNTEFLSEAFTEKEQGYIPTVTVEAHKNYTYPAYNPGRPTQDKIFVFSIDEVHKYLGISANAGCKPTPYAKKNGVYTGTGGKCWWWLRSPGYGNTLSPDVTDKGEVYTSGHNVNSDDTAVRPAMWVSVK